MHRSKVPWEHDDRKPISLQFFQKREKAYIVSKINYLVTDIY